MVGACRRAHHKPPSEAHFLHENRFIATSRHPHAGRQYCSPRWPGLSSYQCRARARPSGNRNSLRQLNARSLTTQAKKICRSGDLRTLGCTIKARYPKRFKISLGNPLTLENHFRRNRIALESSHPSARPRPDIRTRPIACPRRVPHP